MKRLGLLGAALSLVPLLSPRRRIAALVEDLVIQTADEVIAEEIVVRSRVVADKPPRKLPPRLDGIGVHDARLTVKSDDGVGNADAWAAGTGLVTWLREHPYVAADVQSAWTSPLQVASTLVSKDDKTGLVIAGIRGGEAEPGDKEPGIEP